MTSRAALAVRFLVAAAGIVPAVVLPAGCSRVTGLPEVPASVSAREAGLEALQALADESRRLAPPPGQAGVPGEARPPGGIGVTDEDRALHGARASEGTGVPDGSGETGEVRGTREAKGSDQAQAAGGRGTGQARVPSGIKRMVTSPLMRPSLATPEEPVERARGALDLLAQGRRLEGLRSLAEALAERPSDLVLGNTYRMAVYRLTRAILSEAKARGERTPELPEFLRGEPLATLERVAARAPGREIRLQVALAYVDRMVLNPALEIKAPASIDSVRVLTEILEAHPYYIPALVGRGLNHLYRPRKLAWPEHPAPPPDAASRDLSLAVAVGAKVGGAPAHLKGLLLMMLGDACAAEGRVGVARSWWVVARETAGAGTIHDEVAARMAWNDAEAPDRLEERLEERMADMDHPVGDLSFLWSESKGPS